jgi:hypothetical protein
MQPLSFLLHRGAITSTLANSLNNGCGQFFHIVLMGDNDVIDI